MKTVTDYIEKREQWKEGLELLRELCLNLGLKETVKWGVPVYMWNGKNVVGLMGFSSYFGIWFFEGANLKDSKGVLVNAQEGKTKLLRQWRFSSIKELREQISDVENYIQEAMKLAEASKKQSVRRKPPLTFEELPSEL